MADETEQGEATEGDEVEIATKVGAWKKEGLGAARVLAPHQQPLAVVHHRRLRVPHH